MTSIGLVKRRRCFVKPCPHFEDRAWCADCQPRPAAPESGPSALTFFPPGDPASKPNGWDAPVAPVAKDPEGPDEFALLLMLQQLQARWAS